MTEKCANCGQETPQPKTEWLTAEQIREQYGFGFVADETSVISKLVLDEDRLVRVWLKTSVEASL